LLGIAHIRLDLDKTAYHKVEFPRIVLAGERVIDNMGDELKGLGLKKVGILTSKTPYNMLREKISRSLSGANISHEYEIDDYSPHEVLSQRFLVKFSGKIDAVVAVGGGRVIDVSKLVAEKGNISFISVPTVPSHDGIASPIVSIPSAKGRTSRFSVTPQAIFVDVTVLANVPHKYIASGFGDVIAKYTAVRDWRLAHLLLGEYYGEYTANQSKTCAEMVMKKSEEIGEATKDGVRTLTEALVNCGLLIGIAGTSRPCSGSEHLFAHALDAVANFPALHGEEVGLGTMMMTYLHDADWQGIREGLMNARAPVTAKQIGVSEGNLIKALTATASMRPDRYTILGEKGLNEKAAISLAKATQVI